MLIDACNLTVWPLALDSRLQADAGTETLYIKAKDRMTMDRWLEAFNPPREDEDIYQAWECPQFVVLKDWYGSFGIVCRRTPFPIFSGLLPTLFSAVWRRRERERGGGTGCPTTSTVGFRVVFVTHNGGVRMSRRRHP